MASLSKLVVDFKGDMLSVARMASASLATTVIQATPVDTGSARASWNPTIGAPVAKNVDVRGGNGFAPRASVTGVVNALRIGGSFSLANGQPYINRLEYEAWSSQAPAGMVRVAVAQWQAMTDSAASSVRGS